MYDLFVKEGVADVQFTKRKELIQDQIRRAKKCFVFLDPDYIVQGIDPITMPISRERALELVNRVHGKLRITGEFDSEGNLILHPPQ